MSLGVGVDALSRNALVCGGAFGSHCVGCDSVAWEWAVAVAPFVVAAEPDSAVNVVEFVGVWRAWVCHGGCVVIVAPAAVGIVGA